MYTESGQKYSDASNIPYIYISYKTTIFKKKIPEVNSCPILIIFITIKTEFNVVLLYTFKIIIYNFEITQVKHTTALICFETQCNDCTFIDKEFESVFKSWLFEKHASKSYLKITTINYISLCFC